MVTVMVDVEVDEVLEQIETTQLVDELYMRALVGDPIAEKAFEYSDQMIMRTLEHLRAGSIGEAIEVLMRGVSSNTASDVLKAYEKAKTGEHPFLRLVKDE
jgi:hypothetical protein